METLRLKNGAEEAEQLVVVTMMSLRHLMEERPLALYDLVMKCRDRSYQFFGDNENILLNLGLVEANGDIHGSIKNIILSAVRGDGLDMVLGSPIGD